MLVYLNIRINHFNYHLDLVYSVSWLPFQMKEFGPSLSKEVKWLYEPVPFVEQPRQLFDTNTRKNIKLDELNLTERHSAYWPPPRTENAELETHSKLTRSRARSLHATGIKFYSDLWFLNEWI